PLMEHSTSKSGAGSPGPSPTAASTVATVASALASTPPASHTATAAAPENLSAAAISPAHFHATFGQPQTSTFSLVGNNDTLSCAPNGIDKHSPSHSPVAHSR